MARIIRTRQARNDILDIWKYLFRAYLELAGRSFVLIRKLGR